MGVIILTGVELISDWFSLTVNRSGDFGNIALLQSAARSGALSQFH